MIRFEWKLGNVANEHKFVKKYSNECMWKPYQSYIPSELQNMDVWIYFTFTIVILLLH